MTQLFHIDDTNRRPLAMLVMEREAERTCLEALWDAGVGVEVIQQREDESLDALYRRLRDRLLARAEAGMTPSEVVLCSTEAGGGSCLEARAFAVRATAAVMARSGCGRITLSGTLEPRALRALASTSRLLLSGTSVEVQARALPTRDVA